MQILVINSGSSSLKFKLFRLAADHHVVLAAGLVEEIGGPAGRVHVRWPAGEVNVSRRVPDHHSALEIAEEQLLTHGILPDFNRLAAVAHRVVHGGEKFTRPVLVDERVLAAIRELEPLAPLHNPYNLEGIVAMGRRAPAVPQVAVFDTAFHQQLPPAAHVYALPYGFYAEHGVRRYGFHGISHAYLARTAAAFLDRPERELRLITLHLGNGASAAAIRGGVSVDTSMGMTPMEGLVMGTRSG
ncbi:MAG: acetate kinase, partial [Deltaproteobacteria bacterium]|nr:acetate kinase [Deltaproteobacteria bacterium]